MSTKSVTMPVTGRSCVNCAQNIERSIGKLPGIGEVNVNFDATASPDPCSTGHGDEQYFSRHEQFAPV